MINNHKLGIFKDIPENVTGEAWHVRAPCHRSPLLSEHLQRDSLKFRLGKNPG